MMDDMNDSWVIKLRDAIIMQAVKDWRDICRRNRHSATLDDSQFYELVRFFSTDCNGLLLGVQLNGKDLLDKLCLSSVRRNVISERSKK